MKRLLLFIFSIFFLGSSLVYAENIVINTKGESVLLKDDGTWVVISNEGEEGKLVFLIRKATDLHLSYDKKDDMDEFSHYMNLVGCSYTVEVIKLFGFTVVCLLVDLFKHLNHFLASLFRTPNALQH